MKEAGKEQDRLVVVHSVWFYLASWPVTIAIAFVILCSIWIFRSPETLRDAMIGIASAKWGAIPWIVICVLLVVQNIITIVYSRSIFREKDLRIAELKERITSSEGGNKS